MQVFIREGGEGHPAVIQTVAVKGLEGQQEASIT